MPFNSIGFFCFFLITITILFASPHRFRWAIMLIASCFFYMTFIPQHILILFLTIFIGYFFGILIAKTRRKKIKKTWLFISISLTTSVLIFFKYFNFFHLTSLFPIMNIAVPIGLSFQTFQSLSYLIEVYKNKQNVEHHFGIYALSIMLFAKLIAGPIERPQNILPQLYEKRNFNSRKVTRGLRLILWGMFKKIVIADSLALYVNQIYDNPHAYIGITLIIATIFFAYQIYCDFSGYSDIAIGCAQVIGIQLTSNFNLPYSSQSISEFWKRWHITLSSWLKDYIYIPLGGNRVPRLRNYFNLLATFSLSGLWHGANWTFIAWGILHAAYLITENLTTPIRNITPKILQRIVTFALICFSWIFFRANNLADAFYIVMHLFDGVTFFFLNVFTHLDKLNVGYGSLRPILIDWPKPDFIRLVIYIFLIELFFMFQKKENINTIFEHLPISVRWLTYYILIFAILLTDENTNQQFIYFRF